MSRLSPGDRAPAFTLTADDGRRIALKDFAGQRVVVYFYPKDSTPGCTKEACQFSERLADLRSLGVSVLGISPDSTESHRRFKQDQGISFPLLSDPDRTVMAKYGAFGEKVMYGKRVEGVIRSTFIISPTGRIERAWYQVRADGHAAKVLEALASLD